MKNLLKQLQLSKEKINPVTDDIKKYNIRGSKEKWNIKGNITIGSYTSINGYFKARGSVHIGKYCAFGNDVALVAGNHKTSMMNQQVCFKNV